MNIAPLNDNVVIRREDIPEVSAGGIILPTKKENKSHFGTVIAVGPGIKNSDGEYLALSVSVGDIVIFDPEAGNPFSANANSYLMMAESNIFAVVS